MKKLYDSSDLPSQGDQDQIKRLYRYINDVARKLDEFRGRACSIRDLFTPLQLSQRSRLREHCEKLIFSNPLTYGSKCEELLWRKAYYDVVATAKRLKQSADFNAEEAANLDAHINAGIGHYHHILARLQIEYNLNLFGVIDFTIMDSNSDERTSKPSIDEKVQEWAKHSVHKCLIYLGDLNRYRIEIKPEQHSALAIRYYVQAFNFNPDLGIPHNQLGSLALTHNYSLDAAYHYMRCLCCPQPFDGSESNLIRLFEKNVTIFDEITHDKDVEQPITHIKRLIVQFLYLIYAWFFDKNISNINGLCQQILSDLQTCITYPKPLSSESEESAEESTNKSEENDLLAPQYLRPDIVFKMCVMCLLCIWKLKQNSSKRVSSVVAFTLAIYSQLVKEVVQHIQDSVLNLSIVATPDLPKRKSKSILKLRRRRRTRINSSEESDLSDNEIPYNSSSSECNSDISELDEKELDTESETSGSEESDAEPLKENGHAKQVEISVTSVVNGIAEENGIEKLTESVKKLRQLDPNDVLELIADEAVLQSIKVLGDWLQGDIEVLKACGQSSSILIQRVIQLLNLININTAKKRYLDNVRVNPELLDKIHSTIALPEDFILRKLPVLQLVQKNIKWDETFNNKIYLPKEEALIRLYKLIAFGRFLQTIPETRVTYNERDRHFYVAEIAEFGDCKTNSCVITEETNHKADGTGDPGQQISRGELMKSMGQLWLAAEIRDLEYKVRGRTALSPYLVLDTDALIHHTHLVKQLVAARKFIVVVPSVVVSNLDELKRETGKARDAIRWLEAQFQRGNRFLRAQRNHEHASIPLIKYPKKKDKQAFTYIHIIECCYYLTKQQKDVTADLVTLLTGKPLSNNTDTKEISYTGLAQTAGITLEHIVTFHTKWKKSLKGQR